MKCLYNVFLGKHILYIIVFTLVFPVTAYCQTSTGRLTIGCYYFDGWTGRTPHVTTKLKLFKDRMPVNGWLTSSAKSVKEQIDQAANAGISFFNFCWYYDGNYDTDVSLNARNNAMSLYLKSPNRDRLMFCILVANHGTYTIDKLKWNKLTRYWCQLFKKPTYLRIDNKPIITFFSITSLLKTFDNVDGVKLAMQKFRQEAERSGLKGLQIVMCVNGSQAETKLAKLLGADVVTAYNNHSYSLSKSKSSLTNIDVMQEDESQIWTNISNSTSLPQIPCITLNWDNRPWDLDSTSQSTRFYGYSKTSVKNSISSCERWVNINSKKILPNKMVNVFAWNEYGEGAWLTPSIKLKDSLLQGLSEALLDKK